MTTGTIAGGFLTADTETARPRPDVDTDTDTDGEAPYGLRGDGTPRAKPGRKPGQATGTARQPRRPARPAPARPAPKAAAKKAPGPDYRPGIRGLFQLAAAPLSIVGMRSPAALADAAAITVHGDGIAEALHQLAVERPEVAAVLERILQAGPYGAIIGATLPLVVQLLTNHGALPAAIGQAMGAMDPAELVRLVRDDMATAGA